MPGLPLAALSPRTSTRLAARSMSPVRHESHDRRTARCALSSTCARAGKLAGMRDGFALSLAGVTETLAISIPTVLEAARGTLTMETCDERLARWSERLLARAEVTLHVHGREHVEPGRTYVVMSNHRSLFDVPVLFHAYPGRLRMVAKTELFKVPVWGHAMRVAGFIEVDRQNSTRAIASLRNARSVLDGGVSVWIAPEGTRSRTGALGAFKSGGFMLALETAHPILPVALRGTEQILPAKGALVRRGAEVHVTFAPAIDPQAFGKSRRTELTAHVRAQIASLLERDGAQTR